MHGRLCVQADVPILQENLESVPNIKNIIMTFAKTSTEPKSQRPKKGLVVEGHTD